MQNTHTFTLTISTLDELLFNDAAVSVTVPGSEGELTLLAHHEPFITLLSRGTITVHTAAGDRRTFAIEKGVLEASGSQITLLV
jgi:F-type H+-transporting ATPase subunit epsilon